MGNVIIVGAGIAGLSAGIYAQRSGFNTVIYESHNLPGGASTSWRRKGYLFEGGLHWLTGSSPKKALNKLWREVGALDDTTKVLYRDPFFVLDYERTEVCLYRDAEKLRAHFLKISPEDAQEINTLCDDIKKFESVSMPVSNIRGIRMREKTAFSLSELFKTLRAVPRMMFYSSITVKEYAARFQSPAIRLLFESAIGPEQSATGLVFTIATLTCGDGGYPEGGSLAMTRRMADLYERLDGKIEYSKKVARILLKDGKTTGVELNDGTIVHAQAVIVTQDTRMAIDTLFTPPLNEKWMQRMRENTNPLLNTFIALGVEADLSMLPERLHFVPDEPFFCGGKQEPVVNLCNYAGYSGYAPDGCTALTGVIIGDTYDFWKAAKENGSYRSEKEKLAEKYIGILTRKFPQLEGKIAVWDVATPLTYERYLNSYKGSWMSVSPVGTAPAAYPCKSESVNNLYFAGQRLMNPGGVPVALTTGRTAAQHLCKDFKHTFVSN